MEELLKALIAAKQEFVPINKDKKHPRGMYASLDSVLASVEPALHKNGLCIVQRIENKMCDGIPSVMLLTTLYHASGQSLQTEYPLPASCKNQQDFGSAITYARRYSVCGLLSVTADEDTDGNTSNSAGYQRSQPRPPQSSPRSKLASKAELESLWETARGNGFTGEDAKAVLESHGITSSNAVPVEKLPQLRKIFGKAKDTQQHPAVPATVSEGVA